MKKVAFYLMTSKGFYVLHNFIKKHGAQNIEYVVSEEDKKLQKDFFYEIRQLAVDNNIKFFKKSDMPLLLEAQDIYKFAISWRWIIKECNNLIVLHDSLLPKYRGFAPLVNCLINGETRIGVTAIWATDEYDKGDIICQKSIDISYPIKIHEVIKRIEPLYFKIVDEIFRKLQNGEVLESRKQDENEASYSLWLDDEDYFIDWSWDSEKIKRFVDAVGYPYDGAKAFLKDKIVRILDVEVIEDVFIEDREKHIGKVIFLKNGVPVVVCGKGLVGLKNLKDLQNKELSINLRSRFK